MQRYRTALIITLILASAADLFFTAKLISKYGIVVEANPIAAMVYNQFQFSGLVVYKFVMVAFIVTLIRMIDAKGGHTMAILLYWFAIIATYVAAIIGAVLDAQL